MNLNPDYLDIACRMLAIEVPDLEDELKLRLEVVNDLIQGCRYPGEENVGLRSRQVVAMIIEQWQRDERKRMDDCETGRWQVPECWPGESAIG